MIKIKCSFFDLLKNEILTNNKIKKYYFKNYSNTKYKLDDILNGILFVLKTGVSWRDSKSIVNWQSLYFHFQRFVEFQIFLKLFLKLRSKFMKNNSTNVQIIDSTFILNKFGKNFIARNKFFKSKNCNKVSLITDINGVPLSAIINTGNVHDNSFIQPHVKDLYILNKKYNKKPIILLADKAYESKQIRANILPSYELMVAKKINAKTNYTFDPILYKNRICIEHTFQKLKVYRRIMIRYDSLIKNYVSFLSLALSQIIYKKIN
jgi:transposase